MSRRTLAGALSASLPRLLVSPVRADEPGTSISEVVVTGSRIPSYAAMAYEKSFHVATPRDSGFRRRDFALAAAERLHLEQPQLRHEPAHGNGSLALESIDGSMADVEHQIEIAQHHGPVHENHRQRGDGHGELATLLHSSAYRAKRLRALRRVAERDKEAAHEISHAGPESRFGKDLHHQLRRLGKWPARRAA